MGYVVDETGIEISSERVKPKKNWPIPKNKRELQRFLGTVGYYQNFMENFSSIANSLYDLTKDNKKFEWTEKEDLAFNKLK